MDEDGDERDDTKRRTRNLSEKKRRDQFNLMLNELSSMVSNTSRKMDKSTVLKSTISFLKHHNDVTVRSRAHEVQDDWKPHFLSNEEFTYLLLEALEGFLIVFSATGRIYYVSDNINPLLGHKPGDLLTQSLFDLIHKEDRTHLYGILQSVPVVKAGHTVETELRFQLLFKRGTLDCPDKPTFELIEFFGHLKLNVEGEGRTRMQDHTSEYLFVCTGRLQPPHLIRDVSLVDETRNEFTSRHSLEWKFLFLDHRASPIIGYLPFEVLGTSGYDYYHFDDLEKVVACHEALMQKGELTSCYYRFLTKGQQWIWLQTRFYITYHQWNSKPEFIVCTHRVVSNMDKSCIMKEEVVEEAVATGSEPVAVPPSEKPSGTMSPSCMSEGSDAFASGTSYAQMSQQSPMNSVSVGSPTGTVATAGTVSVVNAQWSYRGYQNRNGSEGGSASGDDPSSHQICNRVVQIVPQAVAIPQHVVAAQCVQPVPFMHVGGVVPVLVATDQTEQLRRKHEELQVMIERQQAELRDVKKQLALARLGIMPTMNLRRKHEELQVMIERQQAELRDVKKQLALARLGIMPTMNAPFSGDVDMEEPRPLPQIMYGPTSPRLPEPDYGPPQPQ